MNQNKTKQTILVVDDTPTNIDVVKGILSEDYFVQAAINGEMALKIVEKQKPDLILLDIMMPEMDGYEVCRRLKADEASSGIPIMFFTTKTEAQDEVMGFKLGAVDYVTKPANPNRLKARVRTHIELAQVHQQLMEQNAELVEAAQLREDVEGIMQHDLKSPLNCIIGYPHLLLLSDVTDDQREMIKAIEESGQRMLQMINMSLDLFKMERGFYELRPEPVDLIAIARNVFFELERLAQAKSLELRILCSGKNPTENEQCMASGEPLLCHSLLANLCKNAIEASPDGGAVTVAVDAGAEATIVIENAGEVPQEMRLRFFEKFTTAGKEQGTGLGTYSAKLITETQKGAIQLDTSSPGLTRVKITLPTEP